MSIDKETFKKMLRLNVKLLEQNKRHEKEIGKLRTMLINECARGERDGQRHNQD